MGALKTAVPVKDLICLVEKQLDHLFLYDGKKERNLLASAVGKALGKTAVNFSRIRNKYYRKGGEVYFNPFHSGQYTVFLYYLSRVLREYEAFSLAERIYYLNKVLNAVDLYYEVELPDFFFLDHPMGTVLGRVVYADDFVFSQHITVGNNHDIFPVFEERVSLLAGAVVIGNCRIGRNTIISAGSFIKDEDIPANSLVFGRSPQLVIKTKPQSYFDEYFHAKFS
ncbi:transferase [Halobacillus kuroshimensis]|uniref:transferase n=1 Tax=Halobacillus kuroshimensis TaxID=302481 RepID=UPI00041EF6B5|nr:transferase [Halobacillus kuroshimensis]